MKRKILSVLTVLVAVLMSTAALAACDKAPAGAESSGGSGESMSTEQGGEPSVSESAAESGEPGASESAAESGESEEQSSAQSEIYDTIRIDELICMAFSVNGIQISGSANHCFTDTADIKPEGFFNCFYSFADPEKFYDKTSGCYIFTADDIRNFINENFYGVLFNPDGIESLWDVYQPESDGYTYVKSEFCGLDGVKQNIIISEITEIGEIVKITFALGELDNPESAVPPYYVLTARKSGENYLIYSLVNQ